MNKYQVNYIAEKQMIKNGEYGEYPETHRIERGALVFAENEEEMVSKIEAFHEGYKVVSYEFYEGDFVYNYKIK